MKKAIISLSLALIAIFAWSGQGESKTDSYYSGDAISFQGRLYVASADTNRLELFRLEGNTLKLVTSIRPYDSRFGEYDSFYEVKLAAENNTLFVYAVADFSLYKYSLGANDSLSLVNIQRNTFWEWYSRVNKFGNDIVTISAQGVKTWTPALESLDSFAFTNTDTTYNIRGYNNRYILNIQNNSLLVFDRESRSVVANAPLNYKESVGNRAAYQDENNSLYAVDDYYAKKFDSQGNLVASFKHLDYPGYDMAASGQTAYVYFSNGVGVVKLNKSNMKLAGYRFTNNLGGPRGWAMGLRVVYNDGDKVVIFNNANILVLDDKLNKIAAYQALEQSLPSPRENLYLNLDHNSGAAGATIVLSGGGYFPNEELAIDFGGIKFRATSDSQGRFSKDLIIPPLNPVATDIKVVGQTSLLSYSISFKVNP